MAEHGAPNTLADEIEDLLILERSLLLAGDFSRLERIASAKEVLIDRLGLQSPPASLLRVRERALANQRMIEAALAGVSSARSRVAAILNGGRSHSVYTRDGRRSHLCAGDGSIERRA